MIVRQRQPFWLIGVAAGLIAAAAAVAAFYLPAGDAARPAWSGSDRRFIRDDQEISVYFDRSGWLQEGAAPYTAGNEQEYPPLGVSYISLPRLFSRDPETFGKFFVTLNVVMFGLLAGLTAELLRRFSQPRRRLGLMLLPAFMYFSLWRFDILSAVLVAVLVLFVDEERWSLSLVTLLLAALGKYYPALFFIPLALFAGSRPLRAAGVRQIRHGLLTVAAVLSVVIAAISVSAGAAALASPAAFHLTRTFEAGSPGALLLWLPLHWGLIGGTAVRVMVLVFTLLQLGPVLVLLFAGRITDRRAFVRGCLFLLLPFILLNRFFSPQWLLWITPLYLLVARPREIAALAALDILLYLEFPVFFGIDPYGWPYLAACSLRTMVLIYLCLSNIRVMTGSGWLDLTRLRPRSDLTAGTAAPA